MGKRPDYRFLNWIDFSSQYQRLAEVSVSHQDD